ncbi:hypothetical protein FHT91_003365 [Rhizobium sp. BK347]|nr:hypothetical protein [Rhizobium sp. BK252]MBB3402752.1 hypothetical protein [Rhizobium sp. BK289]MBB3415328.1 hypothetical protein [Rhizobium sp. BK284]MBB3483591.1 hypothetical protein [Rhizobium sp. BK347]
MSPVFFLGFRFAGDCFEWPGFVFVVAFLLVNERGCRVTAACLA